MGGSGSWHAYMDMENPYSIGSARSTKILSQNNNILGPLSIGSILQNRYKIIGILGQGGMGIVYKALQIDLEPHRMVAIKEMFDNFNNQGERKKAIEQFKIEASILFKLDHQSLPKVYDYFEENNHHYLVMDYIDGMTLKQYINDNHSISEQIITDWTIQLLQVLNYLHNQNPKVIFRDLKPENIMIEKDGKLKLIDFGIAKLLSASNNQTGTIIQRTGSPGFAPIEQYGQGHSDERTDIYALGATMYFILTGIISPEPNMRLISNQDIQLAFIIYPKFRVIIEKAMRIMPKDRYQNVKEMLDEVRKGDGQKPSVFAGKAPYYHRCGIEPGSPFSSSNWKIHSNSWQEYLEDIFDWQVNALLNKGFPQLANLSEQDFLKQYIYPLKSKLVEIQELEISDGNIPFIIVIPDEFVSIQKQIKKVEVEGEEKTISSGLIERYNKYTNFKHQFFNPYLIINVEDGNDTREKSPYESSHIFAIQKRQSFVIDEGIALVLYYPEILKSHSLDLLSSLFNPTECATLEVDINCRNLHLSWNPVGIGGKKYGSPSYSKRIYDVPI